MAKVSFLVSINQSINQVSRPKKGLDNNTAGIAFRQRHRISTTAPLVAYSTADGLQAGSHHLPHTINRHTSLPDRPHQKLPPTSHPVISW